MLEGVEGTARRGRRPLTASPRALTTAHPFRTISCVTLAVADAVHVRVTCDSCRATAEVCGKRAMPVVARAAAVERFRAAGWHHDPGQTRRKDADLSGAGRWYCPECGRRGHL